MLDWKRFPRLTLLAGPAGIGKTQALIDHFLDLLSEGDDPFSQDILYLLPTAEHRERIVDLLLRKEAKGFFGDRVTTLSRLMQQLLKTGGFTWVTDAQRRFILRDIVLKHAGDYFSQVREFPGFLEKISESVGELKESMMRAGEFRKAVDQLKKKRPALASKYDSLLQIYRQYDERLEALGMRDHRDGLAFLREMHLQEKNGPVFKHLFVDGFFDFSPSQLEFLRWLSGRSKRITLTLTLDPSKERKTLFEIPLKTLTALEALGFERIDLSEEENKRTLSPALCHAESRLFSPSAEKMESPGDSIKIFEATGLRGEAEMIAREIRRLMRTLPRLNFSDIAVILRRVGSYEGVLRTVFREFQIPLEMHERERVRDTPIARTLAGFFRIFLEDWKREDLFNFLKSGGLEKNYESVCALEIQALHQGILSGRKEWLEKIKDPLLEKIASFQDRFRAARSIGEWVSLTREAIRAFGLSRIPVAMNEGSRRNFAALRRVEGLLDEIESSHFSRESPALSFESFAQEFLGLMEVDLFSLHDRDKNRVQIYNVSLARQKEYKIVFIAGLLEKSFPAEIREDPILSDDERNVIGLEPRLPRQALERYLFYVALTRAREKVYLSYPRFDLEGHEALPSFYVDEVRRLFESPVPKVSYPVSQSLPRLEDVVERREAEAHLIKNLFDRGRPETRRSHALTLALYNRFLGVRSFRETLPRIFFEPLAEIRSEAVRQSFLPRNGIFKPTGLEVYGRCPFRYFASEILKLQEIQEGIDAREVGKALHYVLEKYWFERIENKRKDLEELKGVPSFVKEKLEEYWMVERPLAGERAYQIEIKKAQMTEWLCRDIEKEIERPGTLAGMQPRYLEIEFGKETPPLKLYDPFEEDVLLRGKIDRVEVDVSGKFALVMDYKTGGAFSRGDLEWGTALQLPLYLLAVQQRFKLKPVGGEIYQIKTGEKKGFYSKEALEEMKISEMPKNFLLNSKDFSTVLEQAIRFARRYASEIKKGKIPVRPRECDSYCPYSSVCRIEKWKLPFIKEEIRNEDDQRN